MKNTILLTTLPLSLLIVILALSLPAAGQVTKVDLFPYMITNESGDGDAYQMIDEQQLSGNPLKGDNFQPLSFWRTSYHIPYPAGAYIDFGQILNVTNVFIYDLYSVGDLIVEYGEPGNWNYLLTEPLNNFKAWKRHDVNVSSRYLRILKTAAYPIFSEIVIYADNPVQPLPAIDDFRLSNFTPESVELSWTDAIANTSTGNFIGYDLRYSTTAITEENFSQATPFPVNLAPTAGLKQNMVLTGLEVNTAYHFALKMSGENGKSKISNIVEGITKIFYNEIEEKVFLEPSMVFNESGLSDAGRMVNEQELSGDPLSGNGGAPTQEWKPSNYLQDYPLSAYIDLGSQQHISRVFLRDINSVGDVVVEYGFPGAWSYLLTEPCNHYLSWRQHDVNVLTRYLRITLTHREAKFSEIVLYRKTQLLVEEKLFIQPDMIYNPSGYGEAWKLADEQEISGDPANSPGGNPVNFWQTGFQSYIPYPLFATLDLGKKYEVTKLFIRDAQDVSNFEIYAGSENNWELVSIDNLSGYLSWNQHEINRETRYIKFGKTSPSANVAEVVVYGIDHTPGIIDSVAPAKITDLVCQEVIDEFDHVKLTWTAPGEDGIQGTCSSYDIRYYTDVITPENFYTIPKWPTAPDPSLAGSTEEVIITDLNPAMKYYFSIVSCDDDLNFSEHSEEATFTTGFEIGGAPFKLTLTPEMILNEYAQGNAGLLVDEQGIAGFPADGNGGQPNTKWYPGNPDWVYPCYAMIDLKGNCFITDIYVYDADGSDLLTGFTGEPFAWNQIFVDSLKNTNTWNQHEVNQETRYVRLKIESKNTKLAEIVIYASRLEEIELPPQPVAHEFPLMDELIGINAFINDPLGRMSVAGFVREYHSWMWCEGNNDQSYPGFPNNQNKFDVMGWNFDYYYDNFTKSGITACPAIQRNVPWLTGFNYGKLSSKPVSEGENPQDPFSYSEHADHLFQYAARYGSTVVDQNLLKVADNQVATTGANTLHYYEDWNEQDAWWLQAGGFFNPYEYAAMASADRDGHQGALGNTFGVKNADPLAKLVMGGLAKPDLNYIRAMKLWADYHRNGDMPADVINVHHYCNNGLTQSSGDVGVSPEEDDLKGLMGEFVDYRNRYLPDQEVWLTEFGYDTHPQSVQRAPEIGSYTQEEVQAQWLVRSFLALAAAGVDKAAMFMLRDVDTNSTTKFNNSGLCSTADNNWSPKKSWFYIYTLKNRLAGMQYQTEVESGNPNVWIYKFKHLQNQMGAFAVWCPTSSETYVDGYELTLSPGVSQALLVELVDDNIYGNTSPLSINNGKVTLNVSERPVFVLTLPEGFSFPETKNTHKLTLDTTMIVNESGQGNPFFMVDEQELSGDPLMGWLGEPVTIWSTSYGATYPIYAYLDLGEEYDIESLYIRDMNSVGDVAFSIGEPGNWNEVAEDNCMKYKVWSGHIVNQTTRFIRVTKYSPNVHFSELLIYIRD